MPADGGSYLFKYAILGRRRVDCGDNIPAPDRVGPVELHQPEQGGAEL